MNNGKIFIPKRSEFVFCFHVYLRKTSFLFMSPLHTAFVAGADVGGRRITLGNHGMPKVGKGVRFQ